MAKRIFYKEYVLIDLVKDDYRFYNVEIKSVGYNEFHIIFHYGKLGSGGTKKVSESKNLTEANALAWKKIYEKKAEKFADKEDLKGWLGQGQKVEKKKYTKSETDLKNSRVKTPKENLKKHSCDLCEKNIPVETYLEIDKWGRGGGNWDKDPTFIGFKKVLCIDCQWKHDIWKKRM